jgi:hypothetical protein
MLFSTSRNKAVQEMIMSLQFYWWVSIKFAGQKLLSWQGYESFKRDLKCLVLEERLSLFMPISRDFPISPFT